MIEKITEPSLWDYIKESALPVVLYGMGNGADMIIDVLDELGIEFSDVFASDEFVRGHFFHGKKVLKFSEAKEKYDDFIVLITFAVHDEKTMDYFRKLSEHYKVFSPTVPIAGKGLFTKQFIEEHDREFDEAFELLADERSKEVFVDILNFKVSGKLSYLFRATDSKQSVYDEILKLSDKENIVDLGAYDGDTIREFLEVTDGKYESITAFEPDEKNFRKLTRKTEGLENLTLHNIGAWNREETFFFSKKGGRNSSKGGSIVADDESNLVPISFNSVDNVVKTPVSFIKMDIEGAELNALEGAEKTILKYHPKLYVCAYHRNEDFFTLPGKIHELSKDYSIYLRHSPYVPAWECNFYCI